MKRAFMKKALAVVLSTAMAFTVPTVSNLTTASAAKKFVALNVTKKTLKVGQKNYKLYLKNNSISWKIKKVVVSDKSIVGAYNKTKTSVLLKGKKEGKATVKLNLKTAKRKKNNTKTLKCTVTVKPKTTVPDTPTPTPDNPTPDNPTPTPQTTATVSTQAQLDEALANQALRTLTIDSAETSFTIGAQNYSNVDLIVNAPNADITNSATFRSITIKAIKESTWTERAAGNTFRVDAAKARLVVDAGAVVSGITITSANAVIQLEVNGTVNTVGVAATVTLSITGKTTVKIPVVLETTAQGSTVTAAAPVDVQTAANVTVNLQKGAEGSSVKVNATGAKVDVKNDSAQDVVITNVNGSTATAAKDGGTASVVGSTTSTGQSTVGTIPTANSVSTSAISAVGSPENITTVTSGDALVISGSSVTAKMTLSNLYTVSEGAIEVQYSVEINGKTSSTITRYVGSCNGESDPKTVELTYDMKGIQLPLETTAVTIKFKVQVRVLAKGPYAAGNLQDVKTDDIPATITKLP